MDEHICMHTKKRHTHMGSKSKGVVKGGKYASLLLQAAEMVKSSKKGEGKWCHAAELLLQEDDQEAPLVMTGKAPWPREREDKKREKESMIREAKGWERERGKQKTERHMQHSHHLLPKDFMKRDRRKLVLKLHGKAEEQKGSRKFAVKMARKVKIRSLLKSSAALLRRVRDAYVRLMMAMASRGSSYGLGMANHSLSAGTLLYCSASTSSLFDSLGLPSACTQLGNFAAGSSRRHVSASFPVQCSTRSSLRHAPAFLC